MKQPTTSPARRAAWRAAEAEIIRRAGSAKFLFGTHIDRQTGATRTHHFREDFGVHVPAPKDGAGQRTRGTDGLTRSDSFAEAERIGPKMFISTASRVVNQTYTPEPMLLCRYKVEGREKLRTIAVPTVLDRTVLSVLLEVLEPLIDPVLSDAQHGYRATRVAGQKIEVARFPGIPRGSCQVMALRMVEAVRSGYSYMAESDIIDAFTSVNRTLLKQMLIQDGCPVSFAKVLIRCLGAWVIDKKVDPDTPIRVKGIPLGNPVGPLLFNFYVRQLHDIDLGDVVMGSYADNFFLAARSETEREVALTRFDSVLKENLELDHKVKQRWSPKMGSSFYVLQGKKDGGWRIFVSKDGDVHLERPKRETPISLFHGGREAHQDGGLPVQGDPLSIHGEDEPRAYTGDQVSSCERGVRQVDDGVRRDADKGNHRPDGVRYSEGFKPGNDPDTPLVNPPGAHLDAEPQGDGLMAKEGGSAPTQSNKSLHGGRPVAEVVLPTTLAALDNLYIPRAESSAGSGVSITLIVPTWPAGKHGAVAHRLVAIWRRLSRRLVGLGYHIVRVVSPLDPRFYSTAGLFGCSRQFKDKGDDHWRITAGPDPCAAAVRGVLTLTRLASPGEERKRRAVRAEGSHLLVVGRKSGRGHRAVAIGFVRRAGGGREPLPLVESVIRPNPTTAVSEALLSALGLVDENLELTIWTSDGLVRSALRHWYVDVQGKMVAKYSGVGPPQMDSAIRLLATRVSTRSGVTRVRRVSKGGAVAQEIACMVTAIEAVRAFVADGLDETDNAGLTAFVTADWRTTERAEGVPVRMQSSFLTLTLR